MCLSVGTPAGYCAIGSVCRVQTTMGVVENCCSFQFYWIYPRSTVHASCKYQEKGSNFNTQKKKKKFFDFIFLPYRRVCIILYYCIILLKVSFITGMVIIGACVRPLCGWPPCLSMHCHRTCCIRLDLWLWSTLH